jgi:KDO2-lipid IV(A) lauroyltransferase
VKFLDRICRASRRARGISLLTPDRVVAPAREALDRGEGVVFAFDQVPQRAEHAVVAEFLSRTVDVDRTPASLAAAARVPLLVGVSRRGPDGFERLEILGVWHPPALGSRSRRAWVAETMRGATLVLERWVQTHPSEWLWLHRRWRRAPVQSGAARRSTDPPALLTQTHRAARASGAGEQFASFS